jgi:formiminotetrahydrofolate cyclodeaminase
VYREETLEAFIAEAAARKPAPGGGAVSALVGALSAAMSEMCGNFTAGSRRFAGVRDEVEGALGELARRRGALLDLVDEDVTAYGEVRRAHALPHETPQEKRSRQEALDEALRAAVNPPLEAMRQCAAVGRTAARLSEIGNPNLLSDVGTSAILAEAACASARLNVEVNLKLLGDRTLAERIGAEMDALCEELRLCRATVVRRISAHLTH